MAGRPIELRHLATNGIVLHTALAGPEDGPLVILLHGFPELWYAWRPYIERLASAGYRVMAPDQRGYNLSDKPPGVGAYMIDALTQDVLGLIDAAGRDSAHVVGHDWGAAVAWWTALTAPDRVASLVAMNVPHPVVMRRHLLSNPAQTLKSWYMFFFQLPFLPEGAMHLGGGRALFQRIRALGRPHAFRDEDERIYLEAWRQPGAARSMINWYRAALRLAVRPPPEDSRIRPRTLVVWGARDQLLGREMVPPSLALCDQARAVYFEEATHWVQHEELEAVSQLLLEHLAER